MPRAPNLLAFLFLLGACTRAAAPSSIDVLDGSVTPTSPAPLASADASPVDATPCLRDERQYGTSCCRTELHGPMGYTSCRGPNVGAPCTRKGDCDLMCGCDDPTGPPPMQGSPPRGPTDGTRGVTGRCMGSIVDGAWYCVVDEHGTVSHFIRN